MNKKYENWSTLIGRIFIGAVFLMAGIGKIGNFEGTTGFISSVGLPFASFLLILTILLEIIGGIFLILGYKTKCTAFLFSGFLILTLIFFHNPIINSEQMMFFQKNLMILGGTLIISAFGGGNLSLDKKLSK